MNFTFNNSHWFLGEIDVDVFGKPGNAMMHHKIVDFFLFHVHIKWSLEWYIQSSYFIHQVNIGVGRKRNTFLST